MRELTFVLPALFGDVRGSYGEFLPEKQVSRIGKAGTAYAFLPMSEDVHKVAVYPLIPASRDCQALQFWEHGAVFGVKGRSPFNH